MHGLNEWDEVQCTTTKMLSYRPIERRVIWEAKTYCGVGVPTDHLERVHIREFENAMEVKKNKGKRVLKKIQPMTIELAPEGGSPYPPDFYEEI